jgi:hypothetical protein
VKYGVLKGQNLLNDTGSTVTVVSLSLVQTLGIKYTPSNGRSVVGIGNHECKRVGECSLNISPTLALNFGVIDG